MEPTARINIESTGECVEVTRYNGTLFTFVGRSALHDIEVDSEMFNHVYVTFDSEQTGDRHALYFFEQSIQNNAYNQLAEFMIEHDFPMMLNFLEVPDGDIDAWEKANGATVDTIADTIPDAWL